MYMNDILHGIVIYIIVTTWLYNAIQCVFLILSCLTCWYVFISYVYALFICISYINCVVRGLYTRR